MPTAEIFWFQLGAYNRAIFPIQVFIVIVGVVLVYLVLARPSARTDVLMKTYLAFSFAWIAIVFFWLLSEDPRKTLNGVVLFTLVAVLFVIDIFRKRIRFTLPEARWQRNVTVLLILLAFSYPLIGIIFGHNYPEMAIVGVIPCPTTALALVLLTIAIPAVDRKVYILLLLWVPNGIMAITQWGCYEDVILLGVGGYSLVLLVKSWNVIGRKQKGG